VFSQAALTFAIAPLELTSKKLLLARDRVGKKPLFYSADSKRIISGSELKVFACRRRSPLIEREALCDYFLATFPAPKTIYSRRPRKVQPGHYLVASKGKHSRSLYLGSFPFATVENRTERMERAASPRIVAKQPASS